VTHTVHFKGIQYIANVGASNSEFFSGCPLCWLYWW